MGTRTRAIIKKFSKGKKASGSVVVKRIFKASFLLLILGAVGLGFYFKNNITPVATSIIAHAIGAQVKHIMVEGVVNTNKQALAQALNLKSGDSLVSFSTNSARKRLEALAWVRLATVERRLPSTVKVDIYEHSPLAIIKADNTKWVINKHGEKIVKLTPKFNNLPILKGENAGKNAAMLFAMLQAKPNFMAQLKSAEWIGNRRWNLNFKSGVSVKLPENNPARALGWLEQLDSQRNVLSLASGVIDLRLEDRITLQLPEGANAGVVINKKVSGEMI